MIKSESWLSDKFSNWFSKTITSNLFTKAGDISLILFILHVHIILKFLWIGILSLSVFSGKSKNSSSALFFLSNKPFNLSPTVALASFMQSKTTVFPSSIAETKNPGKNLRISLFSPLSFFGQGFVWPIKSEHCKFFVHKQKQLFFAL